MNNNIQDRLSEFKGKVKDADAQDVIRLAFEQFGSRVSFASSLGEEDQVITDMIAKAAPGIEIFTLDTGRLHQETYDLLAKNQKRYRLRFKTYFPDPKAVEDMVAKKGINLFYESIENRKLCCRIRKVEPLRRALADMDAWMTGLRRAQSSDRGQTDVVEWDADHQKIKVNPLAFWSLEDVRRYIAENKVDINELHSKGFVSIGCAPCTRAIKPGEDIRAGRWWWEDAQKKECGLHNNPHRPKAGS